MIAELCCKRLIANGKYLANFFICSTVWAKIRYMRNETDAEGTDVSPKWLGANEYFANDRPGEICHVLLAYKLEVYSTNSVA